jgi:uncharacterized protein (DUF427 family)
MTTITVTDVTRNEVLAQGELGEEVVLLEGCYYFEPDRVVLENLVTTERTYTCPYKGKCHWIDLEGPTGTYRDVAWVYSDPRPDYEYIRYRIGFAYGIRPGVMVEKS